MQTISSENPLQQRAIAQAAERKHRKAERAYDRKLAPAEAAGRNYIWSLRRRAAEKGFGFDLTHEWVNAKLALAACEATGLPFEGSGRDPFSRTFDRKDSTKGYTMDNCWVTCWIYNRCKLDGTHEHVMTMARALVAEGVKRGN